MVTLTYAILTHNEGHYITDLLKRLTSFIIRFPQNNIVIVDDNSTDPKTQMLLRGVQEKFSFVKVFQKKHTGDFSEQKNFLNSHCTGDWIFNLDADEFVEDSFLEIIPQLIESNPTVEAYYIPRINTVDDLTSAYAKKWGWSVTKLEGFTRVRTMHPDSEEYLFLRELGFITGESGQNGPNNEVRYDEPIIMWPDYQMRLYKNSSDIKWVNKVHEKLFGFKSYAMLPPNPDYAIRHFKYIERQIEQNKLYDEISKGESK